MANLMPVTARRKYLAPWLSDTMKVAILNGYTFSALDANLADVPGGAIVATSPALSGKATTGGYALSDDVTIVSPGAIHVTGAWLYVDTGVGSTSTLLVYFETGTNGLTYDLSALSGDLILRPAGGYWFKI